MICPSKLAPQTDAAVQFLVKTASLLRRSAVTVIVEQ
jgi:hypothetical protein